MTRTTFRNSIATSDYSKLLTPLSVHKPWNASSSFSSVETTESTENIVHHTFSVNPNYFLSRTQPGSSLWKPAVNLSSHSLWYCDTDKTYFSSGLTHMFNRFSDVRDIETIMVFVRSMISAGYAGLYNAVTKELDGLNEIICALDQLMNREQGRSFMDSPCGTVIRANEMNSISPSVKKKSCYFEKYSTCNLVTSKKVYFVCRSIKISELSDRII